MNEDKQELEKLDWNLLQMCKNINAITPRKMRDKLRVIGDFLCLVTLIGELAEEKDKIESRLEGK